MHDNLEFVVKWMPHRVICGKCDAVLYEGEDVKPPYEIVQSYNGKCPKCAKRLSTSPTRIQIDPVEALVRACMHVVFIEYEYQA